MPLILLPLTLLALSAGLWWLRRSRNTAGQRAATVAQQHLQLLRGGALNADAVEAAREEIEAKLDRGDELAVEAAMKAGPEYVVHVRALTDIGTAAAVRVLERQLFVRHTNDPFEQAWYRLDSVRGLRMLGQDDSLPVVLEVVEQNANLPLGHLIAAEVAGFREFPACLDEPLSPQGRSALRVLHLCLNSLRRGTAPPTLVVESRLGEAVSRLVRYCPGIADPLVARVFLEVLRNRRCSPVAAATVPGKSSPQRAKRRHEASIAAAEPIVREYLHGIAADLVLQLPASDPYEQADILAVLAELRSDGGPLVLQLARAGRIDDRFAAPCLRWSPDPEAGRYLCERVQTARSSNRRWLGLRSQERITPSVADIRSCLLALRGHPSPEAERVLSRIGSDHDPVLRAAALSSFGWWEPVFRADAIACLRRYRHDVDADVRWAALTALARLGERSALSEIRARLADSNPVQVRTTLDRICGQGLTLLWPDLDSLTEHDDPGVAALASDTLEQLREDLFGALG